MHAQWVTLHKMYRPAFFIQGDMVHWLFNMYSHTCTVIKGACIAFSAYSLFSYLDLIIVTYIEAFSIGIKWNQAKPFLRANQGIKVTSKLQKLTNQEHPAAIWPLNYWKSSDQELQRSSNQAHLSTTKNLDSSHKHFSRWHKWLPLDNRQLHLTFIFFTLTLK